MSHFCCLKEPTTAYLESDDLLPDFLSFFPQYLNIKLTDISVPDPDKYPHLVSTTPTHNTILWEGILYNFVPSGNSLSTQKELPIYT